MSFPTSFTKFAELVLPEPSGSISDITLPVSCAILPTGLLYHIGSGASNVRFYDEAENELAVDTTNIYGSGLNISGYFNFRYNHKTIDSESFVRIYTEDGLELPEPTSIYGQYNAYDSYYEGYWPDGSGDRTINQRHLTLFGTPNKVEYGGPFEHSNCIELNGSTDYGLAAYSVTGTPRTMISWGFSTNLSLNQDLLSVADSGNSLNFANIEFAGAVAGNPVRNGARTTSLSESYSAVLDYVTNTWTHIAGVEGTGGTLRTVYLNSVSGVPDYNTRNPVINRIGLGVLGGSGLTRKFVGKIGPTSLHSTARSSSWIKYLFDAENDQSGFYGEILDYDNEYIPPPLVIGGYSADISTELVLRCNTLDILKESTKRSNVQSINDCISIHSVFNPGTGIGEVDISYYDEDTITGTISYNMEESRSEFLGVELTSQFDNIKKLVMINYGPNSISISTDGNNIFQPILGYPSDPLSIESGASIICINSHGWNVSQDSFNDLSLSVSSGEQASFKLLIAGTQIQ